MPSRKFIKIFPVNSIEAVDLEVPAEEPIKSIMPNLLKVMDQPLVYENHILHYTLNTEDDIVLDETNSFSELGIENSQALWLHVSSTEEIGGEKSPAKSQDTMVASSSKDTSDQVPELPFGLRGIISSKLWSQLPIKKPSLVSPSGLIYELGTPPITIGRFYQGNQPSIDLTELDPEFIASRRHAAINVNYDGDHVVTGLKTTNGFYVNGLKINPEQTQVLHNGDVLQFGIGGVKLIFCLPK